MMNFRRHAISDCAAVVCILQLAVGCYGEVSNEEFTNEATVEFATVELANGELVSVELANGFASEVIARRALVHDEGGAGETANEQQPEDVEMRWSIGSGSVTCRSGWPGTRGCYARFTSPTDIMPGTIAIQVVGHNGSFGYSAQQIGARKIDFSAGIHEGDMFNPGKNTTRFTIMWIRE
jgi:hypothetical protein